MIESPYSWTLDKEIGKLKVEIKKKRERRLMLDKDINEDRLRLEYLHKLKEKGVN